MKRIKILQVLLMLIALLITTPSCTIQKNMPATPTQGVVIKIETLMPTENIPEAYPLAAAGPYQVGIRRNILFTDPERAGREVTLTIWYPAGVTEDTGLKENPDAAPDLSGAPYPLILSSTKVGFIFAPHLASHGFVVVGINKIDSQNHWGEWLIDYPLDILFALKQVAAGAVPGLDGVVDASRAGAMGYSFDGYDALALSGARVDPRNYLDQCAKAVALQPLPPDWWVEYNCKMSETWEEFEARALPWMKDSQDGLWQPMTDERIKAVMPMAPEGAWLFGERGLAAANRPALIIGAEKDDINIYNLEAAFIYENLGSADKSMITFMSKDHMMVYDSKAVARMAHFATAFFGYHLQGKADYAQYFSEDFVKQQEDLAWGVVK